MIVHSFYAPCRARRDLAESEGYAPHPDDAMPPPAHQLYPAGVDVLAAFAAEVDAVRAQSGGAA